MYTILNWDYKNDRKLGHNKIVFGFRWMRMIQITAYRASRYIMPVCDVHIRVYICTVQDSQCEISEWESRE
jgi:hypothetical protein